MQIFEKMSEEKIRKAITDGAFTNLRGEGKPFPPEMFSGEPGNELSLIHDLLKNNGMSLPWIKERKALLNEIDGIRKSFCQTWQLSASKQEKDQIKISFREKLFKINRRILDYNLRSPVARLQLNEMSLSELAESCNKQGIFE